MMSYISGMANYEAAALGSIDDADDYEEITQRTRRPAGSTTVLEEHRQAAPLPGNGRQGPGSDDASANVVTDRQDENGEVSYVNSTREKQLKRIVSAPQGSNGRSVLAVEEQPHHEIRRDVGYGVAVGGDPLEEREAAYINSHPHPNSFPGNPLRRSVSAPQSIGVPRHTPPVKVTYENLVETRLYEMERVASKEDCSYENVMQCRTNQPIYANMKWALLLRVYRLFGPFQ